jgi:hypothetical protein
MVEDAVASFNVPAHEGTLANIAANFGEVTSAARVKEVWAASR